MQLGETSKHAKITLVYLVKCELESCMINETRSELLIFIFLSFSGRQQQQQHRHQQASQLKETAAGQKTANF